MSKGKLARAAWAAAAFWVVIGGARAHAEPIAGAADRVLVLVNQARAEAGLQPLTLDPQLTASAQRFSDYMASANFYAHVGPDGSTPLSRMKAAGFPGTGVWGENIAAYYSDADAVMQVWMASPGHRANILNPAFTHIGIGATSNSNSQWKYYWTEDFGVRADGSASGAAAGAPIARLPQAPPQTSGQQPVLAGISPAQGAAGDTVTLSGHNFGSSAATVSFGTATATVLTWNDTKIQAQVPANAATGPVTVQTARGSSNGLNFTVASAAQAAAPHVLFVAPTSGSAGARVIVHGRGFGTSAGQVLFNGTPGQVAYWYDTLIGVDVPAGATSGSIVVRTRNGDSNPLQFTVEGGAAAAAQPELTYCSPAAGAVGSQVNVLGHNLGTATGTVSFNGVAATVVNWTPVAVVVIVPPGATTGAVTVQTGGATSNGVPFAIIQQGQASSSPSGAPAATPVPSTPPAAPHTPAAPPGGTGTPTGAGSSQPTSGVGSEAQSSRAVWLSYLLNMPQPAPAPQPNGSSASEPADGGGTAVAAGQQQGVLPPNAGRPIAETMAPAEAAPGATITIQGRQFGTAPGWVRIGRTLAPVVSWTDTTILARVPAGLTPVDKVSVRVIRQDRRVSEPLSLQVLSGD